MMAQTWASASRLAALLHRVTVTGNTVADCSGNGIHTGAAVNVTIAGNVVKSCNGGIIGDGGGQAVVTGNVVDTTIGTTSNQGISWRKYDRRPRNRG